MNTKVDLSVVTDAGDRNTAIAFAVLAVASLVAAIVLHETSFAYITEVLPAICLPFAMMGVLSYIARRHWIQLTVVAVICALLLLAGWRYSLGAVMLLVCTRGIAVISAVLQRMCIPNLVRNIQRSGIRGHRGFADHAVLEVFGIPSGADTRVMAMDSRVCRSRLPWQDLYGIYVIVLAPCILMWIVMCLDWQFHFRVPGADLSALAVSLYIVSLALPFVVLASVNLRVRVGGSLRLFDGLVGTAWKVSLPMLFVFIVVLCFQYTGSVLVEHIVSSAVLSAVIVAVSFAVYVFDFEHQVVSELASLRDGFLPEEDEGVGGRLDDVPGTPVRSRDSCFTDQKY